MKLHNWIYHNPYQDDDEKFCKKNKKKCNKPKVQEKCPMTCDMCGGPTPTPPCEDEGIKILVYQANFDKFSK